MLDRFARSWDITKQSWNVIRTDRHLLFFPILSSIACLLVLATFAVPFLLTVDWNGSTEGGDLRTSPAGLIVLFAFYFVNFFVITFFNSALVSCALARFRGEDSSAGAGLRAATARLPQIFAWSALAATVGVLLQMLEERLGLLGKIVLRLIGMAWAIATFFVVPVLVVEGVGPLDAVKRSVEVLKRNWGESLITNVGIGFVTGIAMLLSFVPLIAAGALTAATGSPIPLVVGGAITVILVIAVSLLSATIRTVIRAALYQYATTGEAPPQFETAALQGAFKRKGG